MKNKGFFDRNMLYYEFNSYIYNFMYHFNYILFLPFQNSHLSKKKTKNKNKIYVLNPILMC